MASVPAHWPEPGRARDRTRIPGAEGKIACKDLAFVGGDEDIVGRRVLGRHGDEPLRLHASGIRAAAAAGILVDPLLDDFGAEFFRRAGATPRRKVRLAGETP